MKLIITNPYIKALLPMKYITPLVMLLAIVCARVTPSKNGAGKEKTAFQIADAWDARYDVCSDIAIVYGIHDAGGNFAERAKSWRDKGYEVHFMTGIAWGQYKDYFLGQYDGKTHFDEGQKKRDGDIIWHGENVPYIVPSDSYLKYLKTHAKQAIDAGVTAIHLEEPEFWTEAGYSDAFKKEWEKFYHAPWSPPHESPDATYQSSKLKYHLYYNALDEMFKYIKAYGKQTGKQVKCYVPTHSLVNYSAWGIVSPEASLAGLKEMDGYIAQVWTGTSRTPVFFNGNKKERVFENAFLEYGSMASMTAPTGRKMFFLTDPIEDRSRTWDDYKRNYQATYAAQLLHPAVTDYEVMPWPSRIYLGKFKMENSENPQPIPPTYATQMQVMVNALNDMPKADRPLNGTHAIGVLVSNSMMFQRFPVHEGYDDPQLSNFYGMALPLLKRGVPTEIVHMENLENSNTLKDIKVLVMSYSNYKPLKEEYHQALAQWVRAGGVLIYYGSDSDAFQKVKEWWNTGDHAFASASSHLFKLLGISGHEKEFTKAGKGYVLVQKQDPKELVMQADGDKSYVDWVKKGYENYAAGKMIFSNFFALQRGPYIISSVMEEGVSHAPFTVKGTVIDLFDPKLSIVTDMKVMPGQQSFVYDLSKVNASKPKTLASASRIREEKEQKGNFSFTAKAPSETINAMRIFFPSKPGKVTLAKNGQPISFQESSWDELSHTLYLQFQNYSEGVHVSVQTNIK